MARPLSQHVSVGGHSSKHNLDSKYRATLEHVDKAMCDLNVTLRSDGLRGVYTELFGEAVKSYNEKQKRKDRRIKDYYEQVRDDARGHKGVQNKDGKRLAYEQVVGIGNRETFSPSDPVNRELAKAVYTDYVQEFERQYPNLRVFEAVIHMDEPEGGIHLHLAYVPWGEGYKRGMERQQSLSKACENMGFSHMELDSRCREMLEEVCRRHDIERLDMGNHEHHKPTQQYKREQRDLERIQAQKETAKEELRHVRAEFEAAKRERDEVFAQVQEAAKLASSLSERSEEIGRDLIALESRRDALSGDIETREKKKSSLDTELEFVSRVLERKEMRLKAVSGEIDRAESVLDRIKREIAELTNEAVAVFGVFASEPTLGGIVDALEMLARRGVSLAKTALRAGGDWLSQDDVNRPQAAVRGEVDARAKSIADMGREFEHFNDRSADADIEYGDLQR